MRVLQRRKRGKRIRIEIEMQIFVHDGVERGSVVFQPEAAQRVDERVAGYDGKILVAPHQRAQPGVFQLLDAPHLRDDLAIVGKRLLGDGGDRLDIIERAIGIEHDGFDGHGITLRGG